MTFFTKLQRRGFPFFFRVWTTRFLGPAVLLLALAPTASADPLALRVPGSGAQVVVAGGWPQVSAGFWLKNEVGVAVDGYLNGSSLGIAVGTRGSLTRARVGWGIDGFVAMGVFFPLLNPGFGLSFTPALHLGYRGERFRAVVGLASPLAFRLAPGEEARLPLLVELQLGGKPGPVWIGAQVGMGPVGLPGQSSQISLQAGLLVAVDVGRR